MRGALPRFAAFLAAILAPCIRSFAPAVRCQFNSALYAYSFRENEMCWSRCTRSWSCGCRSDKTNMPGKLNDSPAWISALAGITAQHLSGWPTQAAPDVAALAASKAAALALGAKQ